SEWDFSWTRHETKLPTTMRTSPPNPPPNPARLTTRPLLHLSSALMRPREGIKKRKEDRGERKPAACGWQRSGVRCEQGVFKVPLCFTRLLQIGRAHVCT